MAWAFLSFGVSPLVNGSDAELKLLPPEHREKKKIGTTVDLLVEVLVVIAGGGGAGDVADADGDHVCCVCDIRLSKKYRRRLVTVAIAKSLGVSWRSSKKFNDRKRNGFYCCYR